jgi:hypothetical protein
MPFDVLETDFAGVARNPMALDFERSDAQGLEFNLMVKALQRDDPLRRSYLQRRWHGHITPLPFSREIQRNNLGRASLTPVVLARR